MMQTISKTSGQSLNEYIVVGALVLLAAIPLYGLLGGKINIKMSQMFSKTNSTAAAANLPAGVAERAAYFQKMSMTAGKAGKVIYNPDGTYTYSGFNGETETAGESGVTQELATRLQNIARDWEEKTGEPLPPDLAQKIDTLAERGHEIGRMQDDKLSSDGSINDTKTLVELGKDYKSSYDELSSQLSQLSKTANGQHYDELKSTIDDYSGVITTVNSAIIYSVDKVKVPVVGNPPSVEKFQNVKNYRDVTKMTRQAAEGLEQTADVVRHVKR